MLQYLMYPVLDMTKFEAYDSYTINTKKKKKKKNNTNMHEYLNL
jgi:hypothetical protein